MKQIFILSIFLLAGLVVGCQKLVDVGSPVNDLITKSVFERNETAISAMTGIYARMLDNTNQTPLIMSWYCGMAADEMNTYYSVPTYIELLQNRQTPETALTNLFWNGGYNFIYRANSIIEGLQISNQVTSEVKQQLLGEAYFIRAFWYFYLVNFYGDVPLILSTNYESNAVAGRMPINQVYQRIIIDLEESKQLLKEKYVGANSTVEVADRIRPNTYTASALLSRVCLYSGDLLKAEAEASRVIEKTGFYNLEPVENVFLKGSKEAIWQLARPLPAPLNPLEAQHYIINAKPGSAFVGSTTLSTQLLSSFASDDARYLGWVGQYIDNSSNPNQSYFFPYKYKVISASSDAEHSVVLRLAELFLIRAETRTKAGNIIGAIEDLDQIRARANQSLVANQLPRPSKEDLLNYILEERQRELFSEWGHRWLDLKRSGKIDAVMPTVTETKGGHWESFMQMWPIPPTDINNNINLVQNPGYN